MSATPLPAGWTQHKDPDSGRTFYYNATTGVTSWETPSAPASSGGIVGSIVSMFEKKDAGAPGTAAEKKKAAEAGLKLAKKEDLEKFVLETVDADKILFKFPAPVAAAAKEEVKKDAKAGKDDKKATKEDKPKKDDKKAAKEDKPKKDDKKDAKAAKEDKPKKDDKKAGKEEKPKKDDKKSAKEEKPKKKEKK